MCHMDTSQAGAQPLVTGLAQQHTYLHTYVHTYLLVLHCRSAAAGRKDLAPLNTHPDGRQGRRLLRASGTEGNCYARLTDVDLPGLPSSDLSVRLTRLPQLALRYTGTASGKPPFPPPLHLCSRGWVQHTHILQGAWLSKAPVCSRMCAAGRS